MSDKKSSDPLILFMPSGKRGHFKVGTPILNAARELGVYIESVCGGRGICGRCQIEVQEGHFAKHAIQSTLKNISPINETEKRYAEKRTIIDGRRLSCSANVQGDLVIDVPQDTQVNAQVVRKADDGRVIERKPAIHLCYVEVEEPDMHKPLGDLDRFLAAIEQDWGYQNLKINFHLYAEIQKTLRKGEWTLTAAIHQPAGDPRPELIAIYPGLKNEAYGIACDIGSTTIALHLVSLLSGRTVASSGTSNPQIRFGEDLMSRVSYVMMNPDGREAMTKAVRRSINELIAEVCDKSNIDKADILDCTFVGNPVMHHLFLGIDPTELGGAPFALAVSSSINCRATEIDLDLNTGTKVYMLPCIAGHVGADAAAVLLTEGPHRQEEMMLIVDVGTNAEILLGNSDRTLAASSPTGPAFEGAEISCGQRAAPGAIERLRINKETLNPRYKTISNDLWSDENGFEESAKKTGVTGLCGSAIIEVIAEMFLAGIISEDGVINGSLAEKSPRIIKEDRTYTYVIKESNPRLTITQNDVRAIQLAKAALYAGIKLLMQKLHIKKVDRIGFAGAFGSFIDPKYAMVLGLIPDCDLEKVVAVGNSAGTGARMALLNLDHRMEIEKAVRDIEKIETALEPDFQDLFVNAMALPNKVDIFEQLAQEVTLPEKTQNSTIPGTRHRRRQRPQR